MATDYCSYLRSHLTEKLSKLGLTEEGCYQFGQDWQGHGAMFAGSVIYFRGHGRIVAVPFSVGDGASCFVGAAEATLSTYREWPSLWDLVGMTADLDDNDIESLDAYLGQFPEGPDAMLAFVAEKLGQLFPR